MLARFCGCILWDGKKAELLVEPTKDVLCPYTLDDTLPASLVRENGSSVCCHDTCVVSVAHGRIFRCNGNVNNRFY